MASAPLSAAAAVNPRPQESDTSVEKEVSYNSSAIRSPSRTRSSSVKSLHDIEKQDHTAAAGADPDLERALTPINTTDQVTAEDGRQQDPLEPDVVDWDGPNDPEKALNWPERKKWINIAVIASITFLTPLASSMVAPGVPVVMAEFHSRDETIGSFIVSIYILGYAIGPLVVGPMSELYGRLIVYHVNNVLFIIFTIACALAPNMGALLAFRFLAGCAGVCPVTIGAGSIGDMILQQKRGGAMAIYALGPLLGPVIGPVAGGYLAEAKGWRWIFWVIAMAGGFFMISSFIFMRETYEPTLLERRAARLRKETNNPKLRSKLDKGLAPRKYFWLSIIRPTKMLLFSPIVTVLSIYVAIVYGYLYLLFTTLTPVYERVYGFSAGNVGLTYLGIGTGSLLGLVIFGIASDLIVKKMSAKGGMKAEYRLPPLIPGSVVIPLGFLWYGWTVEKHEHWILPILGTLWAGLGILATFMSVQTYLVDAYTLHAASATAAVTVLRSLLGAFLPMAGPKMYATLGQGWGNTLIALIALAMVPVTWFLYKNGERIRTHPKFQLNL